ncbi:MAG: hypothetical protein GY832_20185 [Chloroflexi bacterium]|nr:hypothetical protein [Chloroflexota bacterium]
MINEQTALTKKDDVSIPEQERAVLRQILVLYYTGQATSIQDAVAKVPEMGRTTFYRYKKDFPIEFDVISREAKAEAYQERDDKQVAFDAEQFDVSVKLQRMAFEGLIEALPGIVSIAKGEERDVTAKGKQKTIVPYPRDQNEAAKILQQIARGGVLPESAVGRIGQMIGEPDEGDDKESKLPVLPISAEFTSVVAKAPDGTTVTIERGGTDILEGEVVSDGE